MAPLSEDDVPTMTSLDLKAEVARAKGDAPGEPLPLAPIEDEEEERTELHHQAVTPEAVGPPPLLADDEEDSITATAPTIDPATRAPLLDVDKLNAIKIAMPAVPPRPGARGPATPRITPAAAAPAPAPIEEAEASTRPGTRSPADDEPPTAQGLTAPVVARTSSSGPSSLVPSTEPADEEPPTGETLSPVVVRSHPADDEPPTGRELALHPAEEEPPTGRGPAPHPAEEEPPTGNALAPHPAEEEPPTGNALAPHPADADAPTGVGPAPSPADDEPPTGQAPAPAAAAPEAYEEDDSITGLAPNIPKQTLRKMLEAAKSARAPEGELPDMTEGTTNKIKRPPESGRTLESDLLEDDDEERTDSITAQAPGGLTNMLRVIAADGAPQITKPMPMVPIDGETAPRDRTAVMEGAPVRALAQRPTSDSGSGLRAKSDSVSGERPSAQQVAGPALSGYPSAHLAAASEAQIPLGVPPPASNRAFDPPAPWDMAEPAPSQGYGPLVAVVAVASVLIPVVLYLVLSRRAPPPPVVEPARVEVSVNPLASSPPLTKAKPPPHPDDVAPAASASASASVAKPPPRRTPVRRPPPRPRRR